MSKTSDSVIQIGFLLPDIMSTYGDGGNALVLQQRLRWRGYDANIIPITLQDPIPTSCDLYTLGGGEDVALILGSQRLRSQVSFTTALHAGRPLFAVCAGLQMLGEWFEVADGSRVPGVGILDVTTRPQDKRAIGELVGSPLLTGLTSPLTGFENHMGATILGADAQPLSRVKYGVGNGVVAGAEKPTGGYTDGVVQDGIIATYMHGPCLARNPELADFLIAKALGVSPGNLEELDFPSITELRQERLHAAAHPPKVDT